MIHEHRETSTTSPTTTWLSLAPALAATGIVLALVAPRSTPVALLLVGAAVVGLGARVDRWVMPIAWNALVVALAVFGCYLAINALWAVKPLLGLERTLLYGLIVALGGAVAAALPRLSAEDAGHLQHAVLVTVCAVAVFLAVEVPCGQPIKRLVVSLVPPLRPSPKHMTTADGWVTHLRLYTLNRNLGVLNLAIWPTLLLARTMLSAGTARWLGGGLLVVAAVAVFGSEHETSMLALVVGCLIFVGMWAAARVARAATLAAWLAATLLVVPLADIAHDAGLHRAEWLPQTARNRIVLWNVTADRLHESPVFGVGIASTKPLDEETGAQAPRHDGDAYAQRTGRHAHNIFMQTWYELGAVGAVLLLIAGVTTLRMLARLPSADQPFAYAGFVSAMAIGSFSWGMWQPWFMCAYGLWAVLWLIALDAARRRRDGLAT